MRAIRKFPPKQEINAIEMPAHAEITTPESMKVLDGLDDVTSWDDRSKLLIVCEYIDMKKLSRDFALFADDRAALRMRRTSE